MKRELEEELGTLRNEVNQLKEANRESFCWILVSSSRGARLEFYFLGSLSISVQLKNRPRHWKTFVEQTHLIP
jgi:hypothetical protein